MDVVPDMLDNMVGGGDGDGSKWPGVSSNGRSGDNLCMGVGVDSRGGGDGVGVDSRGGAVNISGDNRRGSADNTDMGGAVRARARGGDLTSVDGVGAGVVNNGQGFHIRSAPVVSGNRDGSLADGVNKAVLVEVLRESLEGK